MYSFSYLKPVCCSTSSSNCCFLNFIQVSQEAGQVVWYSHLLKNFLQFTVIHTVKGFGIVNKAEIDVFLELSSSAFSKTIQNIWRLGWKKLEEAQAGLKTAGRNINNLRHADDTTLMAESEED